MEEKLVFAGFGGQGVLFMGKLIAHAGMLAGKNVTWIPSYGPEMRGGTANCSVVISDNHIGSPTVDKPNIAVVMNGASYDKFVDKVQPGGYLFVNSSIIDRETDRDDINIIKINANELAHENFQTTKLANVIILGYLVAKTSIFDKDTVFKAIEEMVGNKRPEMLEINKKAISLGLGA